MRMILEYEIGDTYEEAQKDLQFILEDLVQITRPLADNMVRRIPQVFHDEEGNLVGSLSVRDE